MLPRAVELRWLDLAWAFIDDMGLRGSKAVQVVSLRLLGDAEDGIAAENAGQNAIAQRRLSLELIQRVAGLMKVDPHILPAQADRQHRPACESAQAVHQKARGEDPGRAGLPEPALATNVNHRHRFAPGFQLSRKEINRPPVPALGEEGGCEDGHAAVAVSFHGGISQMLRRFCAETKRINRRRILCFKVRSNGKITEGVRVGPVRLSCWITSRHSLL